MAAQAFLTYKKKKNHFVLVAITRILFVDLHFFSIQHFL